MTAKILTALQKLEPENDNHWTDDGLPRMETVKFLSGLQTLTREQVTSAAPGFSRSNPQLTEVQTAAQAPSAPSSTNGTGDPAIAAPAAQQPPAQGDDGNGTGDSGTGTLDGDADDSPVDRLAQAEAALKAAQVKLGELAARKNEAVQAHEAQVAEVDKLIKERDAATPSHSNGDVIGQYLARQKEEREAQARKVLALKGVDVKAALKELLPQAAPIDSAMARKTARGGQRPNIPLVK